VAGSLVHAACLERLAKMRGRELEEALASLPSLVRAELAERLKRAARAATATAPAAAGGADPPEARELTREERRALWSRARSLVDSALRAAGLRYAGEMRVDGMAPEPYSKFLLAIREGVSELLAEPRRVELRVYTKERGYGDVDVFLDGEYLLTWRPPDPYVGAFWNWVHRAYNLLSLLAERGLLKREALAP